MSERQRFAKLLTSCSRSSLLDQGRKIHAAISKMGFGFDLILNNDLIYMYGKCSRVNLARAVFDRMLERNVVSWTALMCGYLQQDDAMASLHLFSRMGHSGVIPNEYTFSTNFKASGILGNPQNGMQIHAMCTKTGFEWASVVCNSILDMYSKCGRLDDANKVFDIMPERNLVSWNAIIAAYSNQGSNRDSLLLFQDMQAVGKIPDEFTFTSTLKACSGLGAISEGAQIHSFLITSGFPYSIRPIVVGALVDFYVKCRNLSVARQVFNQITRKNVISWSSLILGYAQEGNLPEALDLFGQLRESNLGVDGFILSSMAGVFADFALLEQGKQIHSYTIKVPSGLETSVANSIVDMYLKCGLPEEAEKCFSLMPTRNVISWTVMITGYGKYGLGKEAIRLFSEMESGNIAPDEVTYLALLSACSHSGLIKESQDYFSRLCEDHRIKPRIEHYACMVDLLGRAGCLCDAKNMVEQMPFEPNVGIWQTLLSACRVHGEVEIGREVGEILLKMDSNNPVNYVMMSNMYAEAGRWKECESLRKVVKNKGLQKEAGRSWVEINKEVHFFYGGDETHPLTQRIHEVLKEMEKRMKEEIGYANGVKFALHDVEEESKEESLRIHSERLAIGLALVCGGLENGEKVIRIFKNLRVCGDCHEFIKGLSKIVRKVFLVRDANRFHKFENGLCSCGDYW